MNQEASKTNQALLEEISVLKKRNEELEKAESECNRTEKALRESEALLARSQEIAHVGSWVLDHVTKRLTWSDQVFRIFGLKPQEFGATYKAFLERIHPDDRLDVERAYAGSRSEGESGYDLEHRIIRKDTGEIRHVHEKCIHERNLAGEMVRSIGMVQDITERKRTEAKVAQSHELLSNLARMVPGVIYQYRLYPDGSSAFPYASHGMNDIYEVTPEDVCKDATPVFSRLHPEDHERVADAIFESARTQEMFYCEFRVILPRQGLRWRRSQAKPQRMEDGSTLWHGIILDVTDRKKAEEEQEKLQGQLTQAQKMESVGRLAGGVAHDFNNMLGVIFGHLEMALEQVPPTQPLYNDLQAIRKAAERSADLTRQLLAFARKQTIAPRVLDLNETVESMLKMLRRLIGEDIDLVWRPGAGLAPVKVDPSQIDQVLANLSVNARDAIAGVGKMTIETDNVTFDAEYCAANAGFTPGEYVMLAVSDDGCGMSKEIQKKLFEPFFTTKEVGKGTGLGMAMIYGIVNQNKGFINVYSEPGQGTTVKIYLPRYQGKTEQVRQEGFEKAAEQGQETVLLVEDEPDMLQIAMIMLQRQGYTVLAASMPGEAIALAEEHQGNIDLLITDVVMPEMNGRDLARKLLSLYPKLKRLFMSGYTANVIAHHGVLDEGVHFIQKPFLIKTLAAKVREALDQA